METLKLKCYKDYELSCYLWNKVENPIGVVQIIHGMKEHAKRYDNFARYLNKQGFIVFASDLRGHGITAMINNTQFGYSDGDIFYEILQDQIFITDYLKKEYDLPISIFAHSFGSFIGQRYMVENGFKIKNIILSGTTYTNNFQFRLGYHVANFNKIFGKKKKKAKLIEKLGINSYGKDFKDGNWLTNDDATWYNYTHDPLCGVPFPNNFYWSLFKHGTKNYKNLKNIPFYLPILIIAGSNDPVPGKKGIFKLFVKYGEAKKKVMLKAYKNGRHELINEINNEEVLDDIANFFKNDTLDYISVSAV